MAPTDVTTKLFHRGSPIYNINESFSDEVLSVQDILMDPDQLRGRDEFLWDDRPRRYVFDREVEEQPVRNRPTWHVGRLRALDEIVDEADVSRFNSRLIDRLIKRRARDIAEGIFSKDTPIAFQGNSVFLPVLGEIALGIDLSNVGTEEEVIGCLRGKGQEAVAELIEEHLSALEQDPDEQPVVFESLRSLATFILMHPQLKPPMVGSAPNGLMELTWCLENHSNPDGYWGKGNCVVSLRFLASGLVHYVALSAPNRKDEERITKRGDAKREFVLRSLGEFVPRITNA